METPSDCNRWRVKERRKKNRKALDFDTVYRLMHVGDLLL